MRGMKAKKDFAEVVDLIWSEDSRFEKGAYFFVRQALDHTVKSLGQDDKVTMNRHVSGQQLLDGIREFALNQYGPMSKTLFDNWNVKNCSDFGEIVFKLVEYDVLGKTDTDRLEDFSGGYDFDEAFVRPFRPKGSWKPRGDGASGEAPGDLA